MLAQKTNFFLLQDLEDPQRTRTLVDSDLTALQAVAHWIKTFVLKPNKELGRTGTVCPFRRGQWTRRPFGSPRSRSRSRPRQMFSNS